MCNIKSLIVFFLALLLIGSCSSSVKRDKPDFFASYNASETSEEQPAASDAEAVEEKKEEISEEKSEEEPEEVQKQDEKEEKKIPNTPSLGSDRKSRDNPIIGPPENSFLPDEDGPGLPLPIPFDDELAPIDVIPNFGSRFAICGNGKREPSEQCDDGDDDNNNGCNIICKLPSCGNGLTEKGETCDDGANESGDGCSATCQLEYCGNGTIDSKGEDKEQCDDGNRKNNDGCSIICTYDTIIP